MNNIVPTIPIVESVQGVTLAGGGPISGALLRQAQALAPCLVAADGGANRLLRLGAEPVAVIGDLDSISRSARRRLSDRLFPVPEQATTDFDKALRSIAAPFVLGLGFQGARADHGLAVLTSLVTHADRRCILLSESDVIFVAPEELVLRLQPGTRLSLYPMAPVTGRSEGLRWPIEGLQFAPWGMIGTSNEVSAPEVRLQFSAGAMLVILPRAGLLSVLDGLGVRPDVRGG